jgi:hypothetical protein
MIEKKINAGARNMYPHKDLTRFGVIRIIDILQPHLLGITVQGHQLTPLNVFCKINQAHQATELITKTHPPNSNSGTIKAGGKQGDENGGRL